MSVEKFEQGHYYRARHRGAPLVLYARNDSPGGLGAPVFVYLEDARVVDARRADPVFFNEVQKGEKKIDE